MKIKLCCFAGRLSQDPFMMFFNKFAHGRQEKREKSYTEMNMKGEVAMTSTSLLFQVL